MNLLDQLEKDMRSLRDSAMERTAGNPPEGYTELTPTATKVADACWNNGLDGMKTAVEDWIFDQRAAIDAARNGGAT